MWHSLLFFCMILVSFTVVAANFAEAHHVETPSKVWLALWALHSVLLLVVGVVDFAHFDPAQASPPVPWQLTAYLDGAGSSSSASPSSSSRTRRRCARRGSSRDDFVELDLY